MPQCHMLAADTLHKHWKLRFPAILVEKDRTQNPFHASRCSKGTHGEEKAAGFSQQLSSSEQVVGSGLIHFVSLQGLNISTFFLT